MVRALEIDCVGGVLSDNRNMQEPIMRDPGVMHGTPVFQGTRVPVKTMFEYLESGESLDDFLDLKSLVPGTIEALHGIKAGQVIRVA